MSVFKNCKNTEVIIHWWWWGKRTERSDQLIVKRRISLIVWGPTVNVGKNWLPENSLLLIDEITEKHLLLIGWLYEERLIVPISKRWNDVFIDFFRVLDLFLKLCSSWMSSCSWTTPCPALSEVPPCARRWAE